MVFISGFINLSNHPSDCWSQAQTTAAKAYGEIVDMPFPAVPTSMSSREIHELAEEISREIISLKPNAVMCQGEMTLFFAVVTILKANGITVLAACTERNSREIMNDSGKSIKISEFEFKGFREF